MLPNFIPNNFSNLAALRNLSTGGTPPVARPVGPAYPVNMPEAGAPGSPGFGPGGPAPVWGGQPPVAGPYPVAPIPRPMPGQGMEGPPMTAPVPPISGPMPVRGGPVYPMGGGAPGMSAQPGNGMDKLMALRMMLGY